jgi:uncharacterized protein (TIGR00661 family)
VLKYYAPCTHHIGFHFKAYDDFIYTPVIRSEIRNLSPKNGGYYTVYLPAIDDKVLTKYLQALPKTQWEVFSKHQKIPYQFGNVKVRPISNELFNNSLENCEGLLTGGGFEGPAEALYLGKKLMLIPMKKQFEQGCNAEAARLLGAVVVKNIDEHFVDLLEKWVTGPQKIKLDFPDQTAQIIDNLIRNFSPKTKV